MIQSSFSSARTTVRFFNPCSVLKIFVLSYHLGTILADELARAYESLRELTRACKSLQQRFFGANPSLQSKPWLPPHPLYPTSSR